MGKSSQARETSASQRPPGQKAWVDRKVRRELHHVAQSTPSPGVLVMDPHTAPSDSSKPKP